MGESGEEINIFHHVKDGLDIKWLQFGTPSTFDLQDRYAKYKDRYFKDAVPALSDDFVCVFQELPYDVAGITLLAKDALRFNVRQGIRINVKLAVFSSEASVPAARDGSCYWSSRARRRVQN